VYPASFEYVAPTTLDDAFAHLDAHGDDGKVLAGGQSLIPLMKLRFAVPAVLVDINHVGDLGDTIRAGADGLVIGARVRHKDCERSDHLRGRYGALGRAAPQISDPIVRDHGTVCGSLAHADPQGDWGSVLLAAGAEVAIRGPGGASRTSSIDDLMVGPFMTTLEPNELITEVRVPDPGPRASGTYLKLERKIGDFATVGVAVQVSLSNGTIGRAGIALTGVGPTNMRARAAEEALAGRAPDDEAIREAAKLAADAAEPRDDVRGTAEFKRSVVRVYTERGLRQAIAEAQAGQEGG
jgi:aerobic carbon-monoxide dehydrogenase medium subunit